jgi:hypothetical protein
MQQQLGLLTLAGNVPDSNACTVGGYAWLYSLDFKTGQFVQGSANNMAGQRLTGNALVAGLKTLRLNTGNRITVVTSTKGDIASGVPEAAAQSIIEAFRKVRFHPGEIGGIPVKSQVRIEVTLEQASS